MQHAMKRNVKYKLIKEINDCPKIGELENYK